MLIKRILLVALVATATMNCLALVDNAVVQAAGVQGAAASRDLLVALAKDVAELGGSFDANTDEAKAKLARSSAIRNLATALGDTTLDGIGGSDNFAELFPHYTADVARQFKVLLSPDSTDDARVKAYKLIAISQWMGKTHVANGSIITDSIESDINGVIRYDGATSLRYANELNNSAAGEYQTPENGIVYLSDLGAV